MSYVQAADPGAGLFLHLTIDCALEVLTCVRVDVLEILYNNGYCISLPNLTSSRWLGLAMVRVFTAQKSANITYSRVLFTVWLII